MLKLKLYSVDEAAALFPDPSTVRRHLGLRGVDAVVVFENRQKDSPEFGKRTAVAVGPATKHESVGEMRGAWIGEGPTRQDAIGFCLTLVDSRSL